MATVYQVPTPSASNETYRVSLSGSTYVFRWVWNERDTGWFFDMSTVGGQAIAKGVRLVVNWNLLRDITSELAPPGNLYAFDESTSSKVLSGSDPGLDDFGTRVKLYYVDPLNLSLLSE